MSRNDEFVLYSDNSVLPTAFCLIYTEIGSLPSHGMELTGFFLDTPGTRITVSSPKSQVPSLKSQASSRKSQVPSLKSQVSSPKSQVSSPKSQVSSPKSQGTRIADLRVSPTAGRIFPRDQCPTAKPSRRRSAGSKKRNGFERNCPQRPQGSPPRTRRCFQGYIPTDGKSPSREAVFRIDALPAFGGCLQALQREGHEPAPCPGGPRGGTTRSSRLHRGRGTQKGVPAMNRPNTCDEAFISDCPKTSCSFRTWQ